MNVHAQLALEFPKIRELVDGRLRSAPGKLAAGTWGPSGERDVAERLLRETDEALTFLAEGGELELDGLIVPDDLLREARPAQSALPPEKLLVLRRLAGLSRLARQRLAPRGDRLPVLAALAGGLPLLGDLERAVDGTFDEEGQFRDEASPELANVRRALAGVREELRRLLKRLVAWGMAEGVLQEDIVATRGGRYVLLVKSQHRHRLEGTVLDRSESRAAVYLEPRAAMPLNGRLAELTVEEEQEKRRILRQLTAIVREHAGEIQRGAALLGELDLIQARGLMARSTTQVRPAFGDDGLLRLDRARHPLLELFRGQSTVPLELEATPGERAVIITGPNTGGKTVALKTAGLLQLMAQAGLYLPAGEDTRLPFVRQVFADIGDEQSLEQNLSTFSAHLRNIAEALREADENTLVILDELGAGTDPAEGGPLAMAILEHLLEKGARVLASTHQGALVSFAAGTPGAVNASMTFDSGTLAPTYRLVKGIPGRSNARAIALQMGLPASVVERSTALLSPGRENLEGLVGELEKRRREARMLEEDLSRRERELAALEVRSRRDHEDVARERTKIIAAARREAFGVLEKARLELRSILGTARGGGVPAAREELAGLRRRLGESLALPEEAPGEPPPRLEPGDGVRLPRWGGIAGMVLAVDEGRRTVRVQAGGKTIEVAAGEVLADTSARPRGSRVEAEAGREAASRLDIRGLRGEEAEGVVTRFLDEAWIAGLGTAEILHGKGEGRLQALCGRLLDGHPGVRHHEAAPPERGGAGVTVVSFR